MKGPVAGAQTTVEVVPLKYRKSEQVIPVLQPLLGRDSSITGFQNQLVIRATPAELAQVKRVLADIDTAPRRLLITVRQDTDLDRDRREAELSGSIGNDNARITVPGSGSRSGGNVIFRDGDDRLRGRVVDSQRSSSSSTSQSIQVLEGYSAGAVDYLTNLGLKVEGDQPAGGSHTWFSWRSYFYDLMVNKFFVDKPYETPAVGGTVAAAVAAATAK